MTFVVSSSEDDKNHSEETIYLIFLNVLLNQEYTNDYKALEYIALYSLHNVLKHWLQYIFYKY